MTPFKAMVKKKFKTFEAGDMLNVIDVHIIENKILFQVKEIKPVMKNNVLHIQAIDSDLLQCMSNGEISEIHRILSS